MSSQACSVKIEVANCTNEWTEYLLTFPKNIPSAILICLIYYNMDVT